MPVTPNYAWDFSSGDFTPSVGTPSAKFEGNGITHIQPGDVSVIPGVLDVMPDPAGGGRSVMRSHVTGNDTPIASGIRSEMLGPGVEPSGEYWYLVELFIPDGFTATDRHWSLMQLHDKPDNGDAMKYVNGLLVLKNESLIFSASGAAPTENQTGKYLCAVPPNRGQWQTWVIQAVWSQTASGLLRGWRDDEQMFCALGPNAYPDTVGPFIKAGVYDEMHLGGEFDKTAYYANIAVWSGAQSYNRVTGRQPKPPTQTFVG